MKFRYTILYVADVAATLSFYTEAFGFKQLMIHESGDYGELDTGNTKLAFAALELMNSLGKEPGDAARQGAVFELALETDDVAAGLQQAIVAGATLQQEPTEMPWGQTIAYVKDPNGFLLELCTPVNQA